MKNNLFGQIIICFVLFFGEVCNLADVKANECISLYKPFSSEDMLVMTHKEKKLL